MQVDFTNAPPGTTHCIPPYTEDGEPVNDWQWTKVEFEKTFFYAKGRWIETNVRFNDLNHNPEKVSTGPKILILGHGEHGKDCAAQYLSNKHGLSYTSSSESALDVIWPVLKIVTNYQTKQQAFKMRRKNRELWRSLISLINAVDKSSLTRLMLRNNTMYCGMRCKHEFEASKHLFDHILYVDANPRVVPNDSSMSIKYDQSCMTKIFNNKNVEFMHSQLDRFMWNLKRGNTK